MTDTSPRRGGISCGNIACANWPPTSLHQIGDAVHVTTYLDIDATLSANPDTNLLGIFYSTDAGVEPFRINKTVYLPAPFVEIFLERELVPAAAWTRLRGAIADRGL